MWYPEYYVIGYEPDNLLRISYKFDPELGVAIASIKFNYFDTMNVIELITNPNPSIIADATGLFSIFYSVEAAKKCIEFIKANRKKIWFDNASVIDTILEEKNGNDSYNPDNLKIYRLPVMDLEEVENGDK